jgi:antitoxin ParD1/3/4
MSISLTPNQEQFIKTKLQAGKYNSAQEIIEIALRLLDEYDRADSEWSKQVGIKIDEAISASDRTPPIDGETFVNGILERFQQIRQA